MTTLELTKNEYTLSTDPEKIQWPVVHRLLLGSYWANDRPPQRTEIGAAHSMVFGIYHQGTQVGFARVITDQAIMAWLLDVIIDENHRGKGLGTWLVGSIVALPELQGLRRFMLTTADAHGLYRKFGFEVVAEPGILMERRANG